FTTTGLSDFGSPVSLPGDGTDIAWNYDNKYLAVTADKYLNIYSFSSGTSTPVVTTPVASFTATPTSGSAPLNVQFTGSATNSPTSWSWDFGDGSSSTSQNTSHSYTAGGTYTVKLTATNAGGSNSTTQTVTVTVTTPPPVASFTATPTSGTAPLNVQFTGSATNSPTSWSWDFGDGSSSTSQNTSHSYTARGTYTVKLTATNAGGSNSTTQTVTVTVTSGTTNTIQEALDAIKTYDSTGLDSMLNIINNSTFDNASYQGTNGGDLIYAKLKVFYDNRISIGLLKISDGWNGLLDKAKDKAFLSDTQKQDITTRATITVTEFGLTTAVNTLSSATNKLAAIRDFFANAISVDTAKNLRKARASLST
ncbi:MAG: PKD domain-containing protein, partial [bacterium]